MKPSIWTYYSASLQLLLCFCQVHGLMYEVVIDSVEPDAQNDKRYITVDSIRITRKKRNNYVVNADFEMYQNLGNDIPVRYDIYYAGSSHPFVSGKTNFCDFYNMDDKIINAIRAASTMPPRGTCPFPKGKYTISGYQLHEQDLPPMLPKGSYLVVARVDSFEEKLIFGYSILVTVT
ncbi:uncharacterized protein LOC129726468 [Wyeomyia smithii]|uniref:uncharacterized protein LOC129726468 n=1 Tax=Wyeomyia smithii TaxID=174621 RepID=UPI0024681E4F|nr:uncharacterized protein LOC129726468 [Wyeomyia smithii]